MSGGKFRVYRSRNGGDDWEALTNGLSQGNRYLHAMREGMVTDPIDPCAVYVGVPGGQIYWGRDRGDTREQLAGSFDCH